jgi:hypothetical protein
MTLKLGDAERLFGAFLLFCSNKKTNNFPDSALQGGVCLSCLAMKEWRGASPNVHGCKNVLCIACIKGKSIEYQRVASGHQTFHFLIILAHRSLPAQMAMRIKFGAQIMNQI